MRAALAFSVISALALGANAASAAPRVLQVEPSDSATAPSTKARFEEYRGYAYDLSEYTDRKDVGALEDNLRRQLDIVESAGFSPRVLKFFHSVPIIASEMFLFKLISISRLHCILFCFSSSASWDQRWR